MWRALITLLVVAWLPLAAAARCADHKPGQRPQNTSRQFVGKTLDEIIERKFIEFAVYENFAPYSWQEEGKPKGIDIGIGRIIAEALGVTAKFRFVQAGENLEADLMNYVWRGSAVGGSVVNVMLRVPYHSEFTCRVEQVVFTGQYASEQIAIAYRLDAYPDAKPAAQVDTRHKDAPVPAFFRYDTVAVENDSIADFYLTSTLGVTTHLRRFPTMAAGMAALNAGQVKAAMGPLGQLQHAAGKTVRVHVPPMPGFANGKWTLGVAVHHSHRDLAYAVDDAIAAALADGRIAALFVAQGLHFTPPER